MGILTVTKEREEESAETAELREALYENTTSMSAEGVSGKSVKD